MMRTSTKRGDDPTGTTPVRPSFHLYLAGIGVMLA